MKKQITLISLAIIVVAAIGSLCWSLWFSATRVAFLNYQVVELSEISKVNKNSHIKISVVHTDELNKIGRYDMLFVNGMGLKITDAERNMLLGAAADGLPVMTTAATNPANSIVSVDSTHAATLKAYLSGGGRANYASMLEYVRRHIDSKMFWVSEPTSPQPKVVYLMSHPEPADSDAEYVGFNSLADYCDFLKRHALWHHDAKNIVVTGQMGDPTQLIIALERDGHNVFHVNNLQGFIASGQADSLQVSLIVNLAHGRLGDEVVDFLNSNNIPLFSPLNVNCMTDEWLADRMGMSGGFMSQSIVTPEIDGAVRPYVLFANKIDDNGVVRTYTIPDRLNTFVSAINKQLALQSLPNSRKRVAIVYYKGPGQNALTAAGMEVTTSLYNTLVHLKSEGYKVDGLPSSVPEFELMLQRSGTFFPTYAVGSIERFMTDGNPYIITPSEYNEWAKCSMHQNIIDDVYAENGAFPGDYMTLDSCLALPRIELGNVVLMPQLPAAAGDDAFKIVHGVDNVPTYNYIASYLWLRHGFKADAIVHFGTHGSLEFTPRKQVALSSDDWADILIADVPHLYIYSIADVGEGMIAKRRSYASLISHLTPPFIESDVRDIYRSLTDAIADYSSSPSEANAKRVTDFTVRLGIHRELRLDSTRLFSEQEIATVENFAEELAAERVTGALYAMGKSYADADIHSSVLAMTVEPIAYSLLSLDRLRGKTSIDADKQKALFNKQYVKPANQLVERLLRNGKCDIVGEVCHLAQIAPDYLSVAREVVSSVSAPQDFMAQMRAMASAVSASGVSNQVAMAKVRKALDIAKKMGASDEALKKMESAMMKKHNGMSAGQHSVDMGEMMKMMNTGDRYSSDEVALARAVLELERAVCNVNNYRQLLASCPDMELASLVNALNGGYVSPSSGGDPIANPNSVPTGRNLYAINAENTPTKRAWEKGVQLAENTLAMYRERHNDSLPRKVSYTLWSGEFIETEGATVAQVLYMLGVEPVYDAFGRVSDIKLIPSDVLKRPRIDVVVQTSGQLRDIAASRLFLINRAVQMVADAKNELYPNYVVINALEAEKQLVDKGVSPKEARRISTHRVFGGVNGNYGTGIQSMMQNGATWNSRADIAGVYINNMGAFYGSESEWERVSQYAFEAALIGTDAIIQPRQSNTWGALSLDHVYEFMGGVNLAVASVTGKEADAYMSDYRNRNHARMQELKEAIGVESRTTILNPTYIKAKMSGGASSAFGITEIIQNTYGWSVAKNEVIDSELWNDIYNVYINDKFNLDIQHFFENQNPAALEEITSTMLEAARIGAWKASETQISKLIDLNSHLLTDCQLSATAILDNYKLRDYISSHASADVREKYQKHLAEVTETSSFDKGIVMSKQSIADSSDSTTAIVNSVVVIVLVVVLVVLSVSLICKRRKNAR